MTMNLLQRALIEKSGHSNGFARVVRKDCADALVALYALYATATALLDG